MSPMSDRFEAEALLRAAASGQIPSKGDLLVRGEDGWFFGSTAGASNPEDPTDPGEDPGGGGLFSFQQLTDNIFDFQVPESAVTQHEQALVIRAIQITPGFFGGIEPYTFASPVRKKLVTITAADTPYVVSGVLPDWHINVDVSLGSVEVLIPDALLHNSLGFTDQLHFKLIGTSPLETKVTLTPFGSQLIDDAEQAIIRSRNRSFTLVSDGSNWWIQ